jgi:hypothetical protein
MEYIYNQFYITNSISNQNDCEINFITKDNQKLIIKGVIENNELTTNISQIVNSNKELRGAFVDNISSNLNLHDEHNNCLKILINLFSNRKETQIIDEESFFYIKLYFDSNNKLNASTTYTEISSKDESNNQLEKLNSNQFVETQKLPYTREDYSKLQMSYLDVPYHIYSYENNSKLKQLIKDSPLRSEIYFYALNDNLPQTQEKEFISYEILWYDYINIYYINYLADTKNIDEQDIFSMNTSVMITLNELKIKFPLFLDSNIYFEFYNVNINNLINTIATLVEKFGYTNSDAISYISYLNANVKSIPNTEDVKIIQDIINNCPYDKTWIKTFQLSKMLYYKNQYMLANGYSHLFNLNVCKVPSYVTTWYELSQMTELLFNSSYGITAPLVDDNGKKILDPEKITENIPITKKSKSYNANGDLLPPLSHDFNNWYHLVYFYTRKTQEVDKNKIPLLTNFKSL